MGREEVTGFNAVEEGGLSGARRAKEEAARRLGMRGMERRGVVFRETGQGVAAHGYGSIWGVA